MEGERVNVSRARREGFNQLFHGYLSVGSDLRDDEGHNGRYPMLYSVTNEGLSDTIPAFSV
jgi:hypothetical protein